MPTPYIEKVAKEKKEPVAQVEQKWDRAKDIASKEGKAENWGLVTHIFQNMVKSSGHPNLLDKK